MKQSGGLKPDLSEKESEASSETRLRHPVKFGYL